MAKMPDIKKRRVRIRVELDICRKVINEWKRPGDKDDNLAFVRCLEDAVRDIPLSADDWKIIYEEQKKNEDDRKKGKSK